MTDRFSQLSSALAACGQEHLLRFHDELPPWEQAQLLSDIDAIDLEALPRLIDRFVTGAAAASVPGKIEPAPYLTPRGGEADPSAVECDEAALRREGESLIAAGAVAAFTVAGGQGTRLGWNGPKGTYPASVVTGRPLFMCFADQIRAAQDRYGVSIPWYIMTSEENDEATRAFFLDNNCFGLRRSDLFMFPQGMMPAFDAATGRVLLRERGRVAMSPDGHGGSFTALGASGAIEDMVARGVRHLSYFQVDNPLARVVDPLFVGAHVAGEGSSAEFSSKMVRKTDAAEKVGVFCRVDGRMMVIEYSDLPEELAGERDAGGGLRFCAGSIAIHLLGVPFIQRIVDASAPDGDDQGDGPLPWHRALKKVSHVDLETGRVIAPSEPNAVKLERFVFDALSEAANPIVLETLRSDEFAPIKNADGPDSPATSHQLQSDLAASWLEQRGVSIPRDADGQALARIEINPMTAMGPDDLAATVLPEDVAAGDDLVL